MEVIVDFNFYQFFLALALYSEFSLRGVILFLALLGAIKPLIDLKTLFI